MWGTLFRRFSTAPLPRGFSFLKFALEKENLPYTGAFVGAGMVIAELGFLAMKVSGLEKHVEKVETKMDTQFAEVRKDLQMMMGLFAIGRMPDAIGESLAKKLEPKEAAPPSSPAQSKDEKKTK